MSLKEITGIEKKYCFIILFAYSRTNSIYVAAEAAPPRGGGKSGFIKVARTASIPP